jgi:hypothetical protein
MLNANIANPAGPTQSPGFRSSVAMNKEVVPKMAMNLTARRGSD